MKKLCEDCKYFVLSPVWDKLELKKHYAICGKTSTVTKTMGDSCQYERSSPFVVFWACGRGARFFEKKESE